MTQFLSALLAFFLGLGAVLTPPGLPGAAKQNIKDNLQGVEAPSADPIENYEKAQEKSQKAKDQDEAESSQDSGNEDSSEGNNEESSLNPDTEKQQAFNTKSKKPIGEVAGVAIDKAEPLVSCDDEGVDCGEEPVNPPTPTPTPVPVDPIPNENSEPPIIPIVPPIEDPIIIPSPCGGRDPKPPLPHDVTCLPIN